ncbi:Protein arginine N-methyltransferase 7 [Symbiodinium microadriaticum]|uniref:Protein arginine N-methyltransferase 7 n=1 Tax=Symbiodinium microadriaticum TaxID=2951 RepID=A0A1Q9D0T4_SYMMI|nr:Protein arginine N-methyltransferase 7 [Symbiodinium microadriaticum]
MHKHGEHAGLASKRVNADPASTAVRLLEFVSEPFEVFDFDFAAVTALPSCGRRVALHVPLMPGEAHGVALWFEAELFGSVRISTSPGQPLREHWRQAALCFRTPVAVEGSEPLELEAHHDDDAVWISLPRRSRQKLQPGRPPTCSCGLHAATSRRRLGALGVEGVWTVGLPEAEKGCGALVFGDGPSLAIRLARHGYDPVVSGLPTAVRLLALGRTKPIQVSSQSILTDKCCTAEMMKQTLLPSLLASTPVGNFKEARKPKLHEEADVETNCSSGSEEVALRPTACRRRPPPPPAQWPLLPSEACASPSAPPSWQPGEGTQRQLAGEGCEGQPLLSTAAPGTGLLRAPPGLPAPSEGSDATRTGRRPTGSRHEILARAKRAGLPVKLRVPEEVAGQQQMLTVEGLLPLLQTPAKFQDCRPRARELLAVNVGPGMLNSNIIQKFAASNGMQAVLKAALLVGDIVPKGEETKRKHRRTDVRSAQKRQTDESEAKKTRFRKMSKTGSGADLRKFMEKRLATSSASDCEGSGPI